ncbi:MAG: TonB-dependent receptor [bacterium]|nr:TonB-dependent receptor [bacterium]
MRNFLYRSLAVTAACVTVVIVAYVLVSPVIAAEVAVDTTGVADEIVVTASRYDAANQQNVTNIDRIELDHREPDLELPLLLGSQPGVFSYSDAGSGLGYTYVKIRGFDQRRVGVLFGGIPLNDPEDHQIWWVNMPDLAESIQDIQIQRGVTNSVGGMTAIGGTVNIEPRLLSETPRGRIALGGGSYGYRKQMVSYETGDLGAGLRSSIRLSRQQSDGYRDRSGHEGWSVFWTGQWQTARQTTRFDVWTGHELTHHAWDAVPESMLKKNRLANVETYENAVDDFRQPHYALSNTYRLSDDLTLDNRVYYIQGEGFYENFKEDETARDYSLDLLPHVAPADTLDLVRRKFVRKDHVGWVPSLTWEQGRGRLLVGGDWYTFHSDHWGNVLWAEGYNPRLFNEEWKYHRYTGDKDAFSLYANQRYEVLSGLTLTADLHFQHKQYEFRQYQEKNFAGENLNRYEADWDFFNPKAAVTWQVPDRVAGGDLQVYGSVGRNHREPTDGELFDTWKGGDDLGVAPLFANSRQVRNADGTVKYVEWSDPFVQEEEVTDYGLGFAWRAERLSFNVGGYWMDFRNEIVALGGVSDDGSSFRGNADETRHKGVELGLRWQPTRSDVLSVAASRSWDEFEKHLTYVDTDWDGQWDTVEDFSGNPIALFPEYLARVDWDSRWRPGVRTRLRYRTTGKQYLDNTGNEDRTIDSWSTFDLSLWLGLGELGLRPLDGMTAFLHLRNLADTEYETWGYYDPWLDNGSENRYTPAAGRNFVLGVDYDF